MIERQHGWDEVSALMLCALTTEGFSFREILYSIVRGCYYQWSSSSEGFGVKVSLVLFSGL